MMRSAQIFLEEMFNFDEILDEAFTNNRIKKIMNMMNFLRTLPLI